MVLSCRIPILASLVGCVSTDSTCVDETSLMQGMKPSQDLHRRDTKSVANLMETAKTMLKNGETADVTAFAQATLDEITDTVIPAIADAKRIDQELLDRLCDQFRIELEELALRQTEINNLQTIVSTYSTQHKSCRDSEAAFCTLKQTCDCDLYGMWKTFIEEESEFRGYELHLHDQYCAADANGTLAMFRNEAWFRMEPIIDFTRTVGYGSGSCDPGSNPHWVGVDHGDCFPTQRSECEDKFSDLDDETGRCDSLQVLLEASACRLATKVSTTRSDFARAWALAHSEYAAAEEYVRRMWADRVQEVKALSVVQCLLDRTRERNGRPCEESTDEAHVEITHCEQVRETCPDGHTWSDGSTGWFHRNRGGDDEETHATEDIRCTDITWLEHIFCEPPVCPPLPVIPHAPCTAGFLHQEYVGLPAVPEPDFYASGSTLNVNCFPHCNERRECEPCLPVIVDEDIDWDAICTGTGPTPVTLPPQPMTTTTTTTTTPVPEENCPNPYGNFRVCSAWGDPHYSHVFYRDAAAAQAVHQHGRRGNAFGTMMQHHQVGVYDLARSSDGSFAAQAFFCHADMHRATTSVNGMVVTMNGQRTSFIRGSQTGPLSGDGENHLNPAVGGSGDDIYGWITSTSGFPSEATDINVNGESIDWNTLGDGVGGGTFRGRGSHVSSAHHQGRDFASSMWMQQLHPIDRVDRTLAPVCLGDRDRTKTVTWSLPVFNRVYEPIISIYMENSTIAEAGLCGSEEAQNEPAMEMTDSRWMFQQSEISQICLACGMVEDAILGCVVPVDYTPPENVRQICEFNNVELDVAQTACDGVAGAAAWLEACIQEYCAEGGLDADQILSFIQQMESDQEAVSLEEEGSAAFQVLIGRSQSNDRCVQVTQENLICDVEAGHPGVRINLDYQTAGDEFHVTVDGLQVCARRTDSSGGWGMQLEIQCQIPPPADVVYVFIDSSTENTKCIDTATEVHCDSFSGDLGNRVNDHPGGDIFDITTTPTQVCARRTDSLGGWSMRLHLLCHSGPAPAERNVPGSLVQLLIDRSSSDNTRCITSEVPVICVADAGDLGNRLNDHPAADTFVITVDGLQVCASRTDSAGGWGMRLKISCAVAANEPEWTPGVELASTGGTVHLDHGQLEFNQLFHQCPVVRYTRNGAVHSVYVRRASTYSVDAYSLFTYTWASANNVLGQDFEIYDSLEDARSETGAWTFCNYDDPDVGYPRDCGKTGSVASKWFSMPGHSQVFGQRFDIRNIDSGASFEVYTGADCPASRVLTKGNNPQVVAPHVDGARRIQFIDLGVGAFDAPGQMQEVTYHVKRANQEAQKFQIYRPVSGNTYRLIAESESLASPIANEVVTHVLATPLQFEAGDFIGWVHTGQGTFGFATGAGSVRWRNGEIMGIDSEIDFDGRGARTYSYEATYSTF